MCSGKGPRQSGAVLLEDYAVWKYALLFCFGFPVVAVNIWPYIKGFPDAGDWMLAVFLASLVIPFLLMISAMKDFDVRPSTSSRGYWEEKREKEKQARKKAALDRAEETHRTFEKENRARLERAARENWF